MSRDYIITEGLSLDDVLLVPTYSTVKSRSQVDTSVEIIKGNFHVKLAHPIIPANMSSIMNAHMAEVVFLAGGLGLMHRFMPANQQITILTNLAKRFGGSIWSHLGLSVGVKEQDRQNIQWFVDQGVKILCVDVAHGDSQQCVEMTQWIAQRYPEVLLISGNVATSEGAQRLWEAGADIVKCGIGSGSLCTTRIATGNGVPQLTALMNVAKSQKQMQERWFPKNETRNFLFIADGGCKNSGDLVKSLCLADLVMSGNLFAGCFETPGEIVHNENGHDYKSYVGSSTHKSKHVEGVQALVECKDTYAIELDKLLQGVRSGMSYQGAHNLIELRDNPEFVKITGAGLRESYPHDVLVK